MTSLSMQTELASPPEEVWALVGRFGDLDQWHPWVPSCTLSADGKTRTIGSGAMEAIETLESEGALTHTYRVDKSPMPLADYRCTWVARATETGTELAVEATFEPSGAPEDQALAMLRGFFDTGFGVLSGRFGTP